MGLTKQYLRYVPNGKFNIINSPECNISFIKQNEAGRYVTVGAGEDVIIWDLKLSKKILVIEDENNTVTRLVVNGNSTQLAVGYSDGTVKTFESSSGENVHTFSGHSSPISALRYDHSDHNLATGSKDTDVVIWDVVAECGLQRLCGHKGVITDIQFMLAYDIVITASKDTFIKMWDLNGGHCFKTITDHVTEVWSIVLVQNDKYLVAGSSSSELTVYGVKENDSNFNLNVNDRLQELLIDDAQNIGSPIVCEKLGMVLRNSRGRVVSMAVDPFSQLLLCHGNDKVLELFYFSSDDDAKKKFSKQKKKLKEKVERSGNNPDENAKRLLEEMDRVSPTSLKYVVSRLPVITAEGQIKSIDIAPGKNQTVSVCLSLSNNMIESYSLSSVNYKESAQMYKMSHCGHNSDVKTIAFSNDNTVIASGSLNDFKIWNRTTLSCLRTVDVSNVTSVCFVPGDRFVLIGTKEGTFFIVNAISADIVQRLDAHRTEIKSIVVLSSKMGCVTASSDKAVKVWNFKNLTTLAGKPDEDQNMSVTHLKTLQMNEPVLSVRVTPDNNLLAVSLLDSTVKIFFMDSFKHFLTLYGHKLPVSCMDISSDSTLIATGSGDRNVKIWGLDHGDCHKSIFAHEDTITGLAFVPRTHYFFTCGKDGRIKQWDADNFERIITLTGHFGEATSLSISPNGEFLISCGQDRVLRLYEKSEEPVVLEDEREVEREKEDEQTLATGKDNISIGQTPLSIIPKKTVTSEKAAELLMECIDVISKYEEEVAESNSVNRKPPPLPLIMTAFNANTTDEYLLGVLKKIRSSELEETLLILPHAAVFKLFVYLKSLLKNANTDVEMTVKIITFLVRLNHKAIVSSANLYPLLKQLRKLSIKQIEKLKDVIGINYYSLLKLQRVKERAEGISMFEEKILERNKRMAVKKKKEKLNKTALLKL